jgi:hypothetical protein
MKMVKHLIYYMSLLATVLLSACTDNDATIADEPLPDGMGRIRIAISSPEIVGGGTTRGVNTVPWEDPDHEWEKLQNFRIYICTESNQVVDIIEGTKADMTGEAGTASTYNKRSKELKSSPLTAGKYHIFATANFNSSEAATNSANEDDVYDDGISVGSIIDPANNTFKFANGYSNKNIPMTGKLTDTDGTLKTVTVYNAKETDAGIISVWRVLAKMQFYFTNQSDTKIRIKSVEVEPLNNIASGDDAGKGLIYLFSKDYLESEKNLKPNTAGASKIDKGVTATWALHDDVATNATVSESGMLASASLSYGSDKLTATGPRVANDLAGTKLQKFNANVFVPAPDPEHDPPITRDEDATITFTVKPASGVTFKPTHLSFKACRVGTDGGNFDVVTVNGSTVTEIAKGVRPERSNVAPYVSSYEYTLNAPAITNADEYTVKIYLYNLLENKEYAFSDVVITGIATQNISVAPAASNATDGVTLPSDAMSSDIGAFEYLPSSPLELAAGATTHDPFFFYVNETDKSFTTINNQLSLRFKIQRWNATTNSWYDDEIRYGVTTHYGDGTTGHDGFNVIRRNDWIHIPVVLTDWQFRVEPLAFVPIAGYPATTVSSDGLTATFSTGGMIALQPFIKKYSEETWRSFDIHDPEISDISISWKSQTGSESLVTTPFIYDPITKSIIGELNNNLGAGTYKTSITVNATLDSYPYSFTFNVVLKKTE